MYRQDCLICYFIDIVLVLSSEHKARQRIFPSSITLKFCGGFMCNTIIKLRLKPWLLLRFANFISHDSLIWNACSIELSFNIGFICQK